MSELLKREKVLALCTLQQVLALQGRSEAKSPDDLLIRQRILELSYDAMLKMNRAIEKKARVETFDCGHRQHEFLVMAPPIDATVGVTVRINADQPRVWTEAADLVDDDYILIDTARLARGEVGLELHLIPMRDSVQIIYTGGMGVWTGACGYDGATSNVGGFGVLVSALGSFISDGVVAGCKVTVVNGSNAPTAWTVKTVDSETQLTMTAPFTATIAGGQAFYILDANGTSLIHDWPLLSAAIAGQVQNDWMMKTRQGIVSENVGGVGMTWVPPGGWLNRNLKVLENHRVRRY